MAMTTSMDSDEVTPTSGTPDDTARTEVWRSLPDAFDRDPTDGAVVFKLQVSEPGQLFSSVDPAPSFEKSLDTQIEEYIIDSLSSLGLGYNLRIEVILPADQIDTPGARVIPCAMSNYFHYRALQKKRLLRTTLSNGRWSLLWALAFMTACLAIDLGQQKLLNMTKYTSWATSFVSSALQIAAWVCLWDPIGLLLHTWRPIYHDLRMFRKLRSTEVRIIEAPKHSAQAISSDTVVRMRVTGGTLNNPIKRQESQQVKRWASLLRQDPPHAVDHRMSISMAELPPMYEAGPQHMRHSSLVESTGDLQRARSLSPSPTSEISNTPPSKSIPIPVPMITVQTPLQAPTVTVLRPPTLRLSSAV